MCLNKTEIKKLSDNYKECYQLELDYADLQEAYKNLQATETKKPFYSNPEFLIPSMIVIFLGGYIAGQSEWP